MKFSVEVKVRPKSGISDPQGQTIERSLPSIGFEGFTGVRVGKLLTFLIEAPERSAAESVLARACKEFLSNPVIEDFTFSLKELEQGDAG